MKSLTDSINEGLLSSIPKEISARITNFKTNMDLDMAAMDIEEVLRRNGVKELIRNERKPYGDDPDQKIIIPENSYTIIFSRDGDDGWCEDIQIYNPSEKRVYFAGFQRREKAIFSQAYVPQKSYSVVYVPGRTAFVADSKKAENFIKDLCKILNTLNTERGRHGGERSTLLEN